MAQGMLPYECECMTNYYPYHYILKGKYAKKNPLVLLKCFDCGKEKIVTHKTLDIFIYNLCKAFEHRQQQRFPNYKMRGLDDWLKS